MKKIASLFLALALCMGLAVPALAAEYGSVSVDTFDGKVTFDAAVMGEAVTLKLDYEDGSGEIGDMTVIPITVQPGSNVTIDGEWEFALCTVYGVMPSGILYIMGVTPPFQAGNVDEQFFNEWGEGYAVFLLGPNGDDEDDWVEYWIKEGDASAAPSTPAQPEQPATPTEPEQPTAPATPAEPEQPAAPVTPAAPDAPGTYTVKKGDTWSTICTNFYGNNAQRYELMKANKGVKLAAGAVITLPEKLGSAVLIAAPVAGEGETLYTVKLGDTLGAIAKAAYGDVMKYQAIFERNSDRLKNADTIYEGQVIVLPAK